MSPQENPEYERIPDDISVVVSEYTPEQGGGWAVDQFGPKVVDGHNERTTQGRWTNRQRAVEEGRKLATELSANLIIYPPLAIEQNPESVTPTRTPIKALVKAEASDPATWTPEMHAFVERQRQCKPLWQEGSDDGGAERRQWIMSDAVVRAVVAHWAHVSCLLDALQSRCKKGSPKHRLANALDDAVGDLVCVTRDAAFKVAAAIDGVYLDPKEIVKGLAELATETPEASEPAGQEGQASNG